MATRKVPGKPRSAAQRPAKTVAKAKTPKSNPVAQKVSNTGAPKRPDAKSSARTTDSRKPKKPAGRPTAFSAEVATTICSRIAQGESLVNICKDETLPSRATVMRWLLEDSHVGFRDNYARAREAQADFYAEEIIDIADEECTVVKHGEGDEAKDVEVAFDSAAVARNRLRVDARKWYASKVAPKKYGDKLALGQAEDLLPLVTIKDLTGRKD